MLPRSTDFREARLMVSLRMAAHQDIGLGSELLGRQAIRRWGESAGVTSVARFPKWP
jgi:hypothetical protein